MKLCLQLGLLVGVFLTIGLCEDTPAAELHETHPGGVDDEHGSPEGELDDHGDDGEGGEGGDDAEGDPADTAEGGEDEGDMPEDEGDMPEEDADGQEGDGMEALTSEQAHALHKKLDANANGKVSLAEIHDFAHMMRRKMAKIELDDVMKEKDTNKDGKLTFQEFLGDPGKHAEEEQNEKQIEFRELDGNSDKFLDPDELSMLFQHHTNDKVEDMLTAQAMKEKDLDKNGVLSIDEFFQHYQQEDEETVELTDEDKAQFAALDADGSKTLTLKELKAWESGAFAAETAVKKLFEHADADKDNQVTAAELDAARETIANHEDFDAQMYLQMWTEERHENEL